MIINKNRKFCSFLTKSMFNLDEFVFSKVSKTVSNSISTPNSKKLSVQKIQEEKQPPTTNISVKKTKIKNKKFTFDPCNTFEKILEWRKDHIAPVDTMGCERLADLNQSQEIQKYQTLISLMLSVQTTDQITSMVVKRLQQHGLTPKNIAQTPESKLVELIHESNFNKRKAKNIIQVSKIILENGLPKSEQQLLKLPGIGVKIAMIYLRVAEGVQRGIGVDTHVHRISNRLGWVQTNSPNETEMKLQYIFPKKYWNDINVCLVGFGQILCKAKNPLCNDCPVKNQCPSSLMKEKSIQF